jgi:hypothetical protein
MVILRFKIHSKPDTSDELMAALAETVTPARAASCGIALDIAEHCRPINRVRFAFWRFLMWVRQGG